ncbi:hypothetical protein AXI58_14100 [Bacillus nakamurai]|uniref:Uncharacterized protein n=1 Tax=Bacillus nakamurai TaxID=1793963 RepID=A0A150F8F1_9BACI|nr:hypothetical protein AXI58_14100 [Bacillus nakamurai]
MFSSLNSSIYFIISFFKFLSVFYYKVQFPLEIDLTSRDKFLTNSFLKKVFKGIKYFNLISNMTKNKLFCHVFFLLASFFGKMKKFY